MCIALNYKAKSSRIKGLVWLIDENDSRVRDAVAHAVWTLPDGSKVDQYGNIGTRLRAKFTLQAKTPGLFALTTVEVTKNGVSFDPDNSNVLTGMIAISP